VLRRKRDLAGGLVEYPFVGCDHQFERERLPAQDRGGRTGAERARGRGRIAKQHRHPVAQDNQVHPAVAVEIRNCHRDRRKRILRGFDEGAATVGHVDGDAVRSCRGNVQDAVPVASLGFHLRPVGRL
jgi:hypothetical protein